MIPDLLTFLTFGAVVATIAGAYSILSDLYLRDRSRVSERVDIELRMRQRERASKTLVFKDLNQLAVAAAGDQEARPGLRKRLLLFIEQSGLELTVQKLLTISIALGLGGSVLGFLFWQNVLVATVVAPAGALLPLAYVHFQRKARLEKLLSQLPDAFDLMSRVVRAGQTMAQALQAVADEFAQPIAGELSYCYEQQNLGLPPEVALRDLARRTGLLEIKIFVTAVVVQQQTGGSLAEMLDKLSQMIRLRYRTQGHIKTLTAEGRMQAIVLLGLPVVMFLGFLFMMPEYEKRLLDHPGLITGTIGLELLGAFWIRKIVNFDF